LRRSLASIGSFELAVPGIGAIGLQLALQVSDPQFQPPPAQFSFRRQLP
jgi:hypothetical protein